MVRAILLFSLVVVFATGCSRNSLTYEQAKELFHVEMTPEEVKKVFGPPTVEYSQDEAITWDYVPEERIKRSSSGRFSGFTIVFEKGKASKIWPITTVKQ